MPLRESWMKLRANASARWMKVRQRPRPWLIGTAAVLVIGGAVAFVTATDSGEELLDDLRETVGAKPTLAELRQRVKEDPKSAPAHAALGHAQFEAGHRAAGLKSFDKALGLDADVADDDMLQDLVSCYGQNEQSRAHAIIARYKLQKAERYLDDLAKHPKWSVRTGAISTLEKLGKVTRDDYVALWLTDLKSSECKIRQYAVEKLGELGDRRALDAIRAAKKAEDEQAGWFGSRCLGGRADEAEKKILAAR